MTFEAIVDAVRAYLGLEPNHPIAVNLVRPHPIEHDVPFVVAVAPIDTHLPGSPPLPPIPEPMSPTRHRRVWPREKATVFSEVTRPKAKVKAVAKSKAKAKARISKKKRW